MAITSDLLSIANSGLRAQRELLQTTGNNIANVNTDGYSRQRTSHQAEILGGVGASDTSRIVDRFAQTQLRRDTTTLAAESALNQNLTVLDNIIAADNNNIGTDISRMYAALDSAVDQPSSIVPRQVFMNEANAMLDSAKGLHEYLSNQAKEVNTQFLGLQDQANDLISSIASLNSNIRISGGNDQQQAKANLMDQRDLAVSELAKLMEIEVRQEPDGTSMISMSNGHSLVLAQGDFNVLTTASSSDLQRLEMTLVKSGGNSYQIPIKQQSVGGMMGSLVEYRDNVLGVTSRKLGQLTLAMTEEMNQQNQVGMDLDGDLGGTLFSRQPLNVLNNYSNQGRNILSAELTSGMHARYPEADFKIDITGVSASDGVNPTTIDVQITLVNADGSHALNQNGDPMVESFSGLAINSSGEVSIQSVHGLTFGFAASADASQTDADLIQDYHVGDSFLVQPMLEGPRLLSLTTQRAEDVALAMPIRVDEGAANSNQAQVYAVDVTNTALASEHNLTASAFDASSGSPGLVDRQNIPAGVNPATVVAPLVEDPANPGNWIDGVPRGVVFTATDEYHVVNKQGQVLATVTGSKQLDNLLGQASISYIHATANANAPTNLDGSNWAAPQPLPQMSNDFPGYDISIQGNPAAGDTFTITFNQNGFSDNANGLKLSQLQQSNTVRLGVNDTNSQQNLMSAQAAFAQMVSDVGQKTAVSNMSLETAEIMYQQSENWRDSVSGVNLDEEASQLIKFQQAYAASAKIISTAQNLFDTILGAVR